MPVPNPTPIYRIIHVDNLPVVLCRGGIHAPKLTPNDGLTYRTIHNAEIQSVRQQRRLNCGPCGIVHDYVPFYFGPHSPMLLQLHTGRVKGYHESQEPIIYLVSTVQAVQQSGPGFVFSDGHGIAAYTDWYDDLSHLDKVDWNMVYQQYWADTIDDMDRQRRKQAEFLIHRFCDWSLILEVGVINDKFRTKVESVFSQFPDGLRRPVNIRKEWYY